MPTTNTQAAVSETLAARPIIGVVRTTSSSEAAEVAAQFLTAGLGLVEITFTVPGATELVQKLRSQRRGDGPPWIGMGTVTTPERGRQALAVDAEFIVTPNCAPEVAQLARQARRYLVLGALTATEIVQAHTLGADLVKVYPLPPVGGPRYLSTVRQPLGDIPMLAAGGFGIEEIPAYREAGAIAFGMGHPLLGRDPSETTGRIQRALRLARGEEIP
jgi:2-dehydro-3-deoxyphosphogluconate aldolase/(4S)-4-hydroxy-2-oxoglutarate aldolase